MTFTYGGHKNEEGKLKLYIGSCENSPPDIVKLKRLLDFNPEISEVSFREFEEGDLMNTIKVILGTVK